MSSFDHGFTLTETLVALVVISLSLAGILEAGRLVAHLNRRVVSVNAGQRQIAIIKTNMASKLGSIGPIFGDDLQGDAGKMSFACEAQMPASSNSPDQTQASSTVSAKLHDCSIAVDDLAQMGNGTPSLRFVYVGEGYQSNHWPPPQKTKQQPRLEAIILQNANGENLGLIKLQVEQKSDCQFDMISRNCRNP